MQGVPDQPDSTCPDSLGDFGVVPELSTPGAPVLKAPAASEENMKAWGKDELDRLDSAWFDRLDMGYDFSDLLDGHESLFIQDGLVPSSPSVMVPTMSQSAIKDQPLLSEEIAVPQGPMSEDFSAPWAKLPNYLEDDAMVIKDEMMEFVEKKTEALALVPVSPAQAAINRAERLAKCRDKKKNRTFEKTIRYATRKAYAEIRPRIKGRFVKKEELEAYRAMVAGDGMMADDDCVVPSFVC